MIANFSTALYQDRQTLFDCQLSFYMWNYTLTTVPAINVASFQVPQC